MSLVSTDPCERKKKGTKTLFKKGQKDLYYDKRVLTTFKPKYLEVGLNSSSGLEKCQTIMHVTWGASTHSAFIQEGLWGDSDLNTSANTHKEVGNAPWVYSSIVLKNASANLPLFSV